VAHNDLPEFQRLSALPSDVRTEGEVFHDTGVTAVTFARLFSPDTLEDPAPALDRRERA
jgi:hypothetical protein